MTLDHSLNKVCSHWEAEEELASSRSMDWTAQRQADMSCHQWRLTLSQGEAAGWSAGGAGGWWSGWGVFESFCFCDWWTCTSSKPSRWKNKRSWINPLSIHHCHHLFFLHVLASQQSAKASTNAYFKFLVVVFFLNKSTICSVIAVHHNFPGSKVMLWTECFV